MATINDCVSVGIKVLIFAERSDLWATSVTLLILPIHLSRTFLVYPYNVHIKRNRDIAVSWKGYNA
jgi:hypothetical protein